MTETTSIQHFTNERQTYAPVAQQPGLLTFVAQAAIGSFCGSFLVLIARILLVYSSDNGAYVDYVPLLMAWGLATGLVAGFLIWAASKEVDGQLLPITRLLIGVFVTGLAWFAFWLYLIREDIPSETQLWLLAGIVVSGIAIGSVTGSALRPWHELVRGGETKATSLKILAGFVGSVLRVVIVFCFLVTLILALATVQRYILGPQLPYNYLRSEMPWELLILGHFALGVVVLFARMRFLPLVVLTVVSAAPVLASLWLTAWEPAARNFLIGYLAVWAMFLLTRWRQTDIAWSYTKAELRYYLID